jgi:hypothetical protein
MEDRDNWERMIRKVEDLESEYAEREKQAKREAKEKKRK